LRAGLSWAKRLSSPPALKSEKKKGRAVTDALPPQKGRKRRKQNHAGKNERVNRLVCALRIFCEVKAGGEEGGVIA